MAQPALGRDYRDSTVAECPLQDSGCNDVACCRGGSVVFHEVNIMATGKITAMRNLDNPIDVFLTAEGAVVFAGVTLSLWAIALGPVSLTVTLMSTRPLFVFALSVLVSSSVWRLLDGPLDRKTLANKLVSTTMIVAGISAISLL